jgi:glyoxylase-like metal-dependent hydrolase (beta-lactamase superfamily II)
MRPLACFLFSLLLLFPGNPALAQAPKASTQVPGYYRITVGQFEITALHDGGIELKTSLLRTVTPPDLDRLLARKFVGNPVMQGTVNAYLINTGDHLILIDTGAGTHFGPTLGGLLANLRAAGYEPDQVDMVLLTHMHVDHLGGLINEDEEPTFPDATVWVAQAENDFWLSEHIAATMPEERQRFFELARKNAEPYQAEEQWHTFNGGEIVLVPGVRAIKADGHTPGHTAFVIESEEQKLVIWGDIVHAHAVQFARPEVSIEFDVDKQRAVATRKALFQELAASGTLVAGMHLPFPGIGRIRAEGQDSYAYVPIEFATMPK